MASSKDPQHSSRPVSQHRLSMSTNSGSSLPVRTTHARQHSHSLSVGSFNPTHRISRRKSVSTSNANVAAVAAAVREGGDHSFGLPVPVTSRRNTMSKGFGSKSSGQPTPPSSLPSHRLSMLANRKLERDESAIEDDQNDDMEDEDENTFTKSRIRRASEGQRDGKKAHPSDLRCDKCGKGYKHSSCLTKHLWEHTPEWSFTSKLLISKHQQVQLLEAASVLVAMNSDGTTPPDSAKDFQSDQESASPAASGDSDHRDGLSSADTTPPPQSEPVAENSHSSGSYGARSKRYSSGNTFSRSYQSVPAVNPLYAASVPLGSGFGQYHQHNGRPLSSGISASGQEDEAGLAAAVELLSCSFGTPRTGPVTLPADAPPVPPLPAQYLGRNVLSSSTVTSGHHASTSFVRENVQRDDVKMEESEESVADDEEYDVRSRDRSDEDDDGVFGRMEE